MAYLRNETLLRKIGKKVKTLREEANLTQEDVFNDTGIHIGRIETATNNITVSTLDAICAYFKIPMDQFLKGL